MVAIRIKTSGYTQDVWSQLFKSSKIYEIAAVSLMLLLKLLSGEDLNLFLACSITASPSTKLPFWRLDN
jgi:hypothetical protein